MRLPSIPHVANIVRPLLSGLFELLVVSGENKGGHHEVVIVTERICRASRVDSEYSGSGIAFVKESCPSSELGVLCSSLLEIFIYLALDLEVVFLETRSSGDPPTPWLAYEVVLGCSLDHRNFGICNIALLFPDWIERIDRSKELLGVFGLSAVNKIPRDDRLGFADGRIHEEVVQIEGHRDWCFAFAVKLVHGSEDGFEFVTAPDVVVVVPGVWSTRINLHLDARDDAKVVPCTLHGSEKITVLLLIDSNLGTVGQDDVELQNIVADEDVETFVPAVASTKTGSN